MARAVALLSVFLGLAVLVCGTLEAGASRPLSSLAASQQQVVQSKAGAQWTKLAQNLGAAVASSGSDGAASEVLADVTPVTVQQAASAQADPSYQDMSGSEPAFEAYDAQADDAVSVADMADNAAGFVSDNSFGTEEAGFAAEADGETTGAQVAEGRGSAQSLGATQMLRGVLVR